MVVGPEEKEHEKRKRKRYEAVRQNEAD